MFWRIIINIFSLIIEERLASSFVVGIVITYFALTSEEKKIMYGYFYSNVAVQITQLELLRKTHGRNKYNLKQFGGGLAKSVQQKQRAKKDNPF